MVLHAHHMQHAAFIDLRHIWTTACSFRGRRDPVHTPGQRCASYLKPYEIRWTSDKPRDHVKAFNDVARALAASAGDLSLTGVWRKDQAASDPMDDACDAVQLPWVLRQALKVLTTLEVGCAQFFDPPPRKLVFRLTTPRSTLGPSSRPAASWTSSSATHGPGNSACMGAGTNEKACTPAAWCALLTDHPFGAMMWCNKQMHCRSRHFLLPCRTH